MSVYCYCFVSIVCGYLSEKCYCTSVYLVCTVFVIALLCVYNLSAWGYCICLHRVIVHVCTICLHGVIVSVCTGLLYMCVQSVCMGLLYRVIVRVCTICLHSVCTCVKLSEKCYGACVYNLSAQGYCTCVYLYVCYLDGVMLPYMEAGLP